MIRWFTQLSLHLKIAIILAPILGILGFGLTDAWLSKDKANTAQQQPATMHELTLSGQCVLSTSSCMLSTDGINVMLKSSTAQSNDLVRIDIGASGHIRGLQLALVQDGQEEKLVAQRTKQTDRWYVEFPRHVLSKPTFNIRLALAQTKRIYLAEFPARLR